MLKTFTTGLLLALAGLANAAGCEAQIDANDAMQFSIKNVNVPASCKQFTVRLHHSGKLPKTAMGHNWVLSRSADLQGVVTDGMGAGAGKDFIKPGDSRVIAHTALIGGGETASASFAPARLKAGESYSFFCSFPGHSSLMKGSVTLVK